MLDIDTAIKHCLDIADGQDKCAEISVSEHAKERISQCAADHRQLAEWLTELNDSRAVQNEQEIFIHELMGELEEAKRLLKAAVDDVYNSVNDVHCKYCSKWHTDQCQATSHLDCYIENKFKWRHADEALALIGQDGDTNG